MTGSYNLADIAATIGRSFFAICCFKRRPQDLPASTEFLCICLFVYAALSCILTLSTQSLEIALLWGLTDGVLIALLTFLLMRLLKVPERWRQTTTALAGTGIFFTILAIPLSFSIMNLEEGDNLGILLFQFVIFFLVWNIAVMAHIFRHALEVSFAMGVLVALSYVGIITSIVKMFSPVMPVQ